MRQFKFRVWDIGKEVFIPENTWGLVTSGEYDYFGVMRKDWEEYKEGEFMYPHSQMLLQYTGMEDTKGEPIYEGDIYHRGSEIGIVSFKQGCFVFDCVNAPFSMTMRDHDPDEFDIVGNIYQNPEMLTSNIPPNSEK